MKRIAVLIDKNDHKSIIIMVDVLNAKELFPYIFSDTIDDEFKEIRYLLKNNLRNQEKYQKVRVSKKADNMFEMRFIKNSRNDRIYCQEISKGGKRFIVMVELFQGKKSQVIPKKIKSRIDTMGGYEYELQF